MDQFETVIIGGGLSGLACALSLYDKGYKDFIVLEARGRVGGRTCSEKTELGAKIDVGGAYVGPGQDFVMELIQRFGLELYKIPHEGDAVIIDQGRRMTYKGDIPSYPFHVLLDLNDMLCRFDELSTLMKTTPEFLTDKRFIELDQMSVSQWVDSRGWTQSAKDAVKGAAHSLTCCNPHEVSMLYFLNMCRSGENLHRLMTVENGAQERKVLQGTMAISESVVKFLGLAHVRMECVVRDVNYEQQDNIIVTVEQGKDRQVQRIKCKRIVMAMSPTLWSTVRWTPPLPPGKQQVAQRMPMGSILKTHVFYKEAHWRNKGLSGECFASSGFPVVYCVDDSKEGFYCIMGFVSGHAARELQKLTREERLNILHDHYRQAFNLTDNEKPIGYHEKNWSAEEFSKGCYAAVCPPGVMTSTFWKTMSEPVDNRIFFAGSEMSTYWIGYMDGAIESGYRVASQLLGTKFDPDKRPQTQLIPWNPSGPTKWEKLAPSVATVITVASAAICGTLAWFLVNKM